MIGSGIEPLIAGPQHRTPQRRSRGRMIAPEYPVSVSIVEAAQQVLVHPLAGHRHPARRIEPVFDLGVAGERGQGR